MSLRLGLRHLGALLLFALAIAGCGRSDDRQQLQQFVKEMRPTVEAAKALVSAVDQRQPQSKVMSQMLAVQVELARPVYPPKGNDEAMQMLVRGEAIQDLISKASAQASEAVHAKNEADAVATFNLDAGFWATARELREQCATFVEQYRRVSRQ